MKYSFINKQLNIYDQRSKTTSILFNNKNLSDALKQQAQDNNCPIIAINDEVVIVYGIKDNAWQESHFARSGLTEYIKKYITSLEKIDKIVANKDLKALSNILVSGHERYHPFDNDGQQDDTIENLRIFLGKLHLSTGFTEEHELTPEEFLEFRSIVINNSYRSMLIEGRHSAAYILLATLTAQIPPENRYEPWDLKNLPAELYTLGNMLRLQTSFFSHSGNPKKTHEGKEYRDFCATVIGSVAKLPKALQNQANFDKLLKHTFQAKYLSAWHNLNTSEHTQSTFDDLLEKLIRLEKIFKEAITKAKPVAEEAKATQLNKKKFQEALDVLMLQTFSDLQSGQLPMANANLIAESTRILADKVAKNTLTEGDIKNFMGSVTMPVLTITWRTIIAMVVGAVIGILIGAMIGVAAGPGAALTALACGAKGAHFGGLIGATIGYSSPLIWSSLWNNNKPSALLSQAVKQTADAGRPLRVQPH